MQNEATIRRDGRRGRLLFPIWALLLSAMVTMPAEGVSIDDYEEFTRSKDLLEAVSIPDEPDLPPFRIPEPLLLNKHLEAADRYFRQGDLLATAVEFEDAARLAPERMTIRVSLGELYNSIGKYEKAIECAKAVLDRVPQSAQAHDIMGTAYLAMNRSEEALAEYRLVVGAAPDRAIGYYHLGDALFSTGDSEEALQHLEAAIERDPMLVEAMLRAAVILNESGRHAEAVARARKVLELNPGNAFAHSILGNAHLALGERDKAEAEYAQAVRLEPGFVYFRDLLARFYVESEQIPRAVAACQAIVILDPRHLPAHRELVTLFEKEGRPALREYHEGCLALFSGRDKEAAEHYAAAIARDPEMRGAYLDLGTAYLNMGDTANAESVITKALELNKEDAVARSLLGRVRLAQGRKKEAEELFRKVIEASPAYRPAHLHLADLLREEDRCKEAVASYRKAIELAPRPVAPHECLVACYEALGDTEQAMAAQAEVVRRSPRGAAARARLARLYLASGGTPRRALFFARPAALLDSSDAGTMDTLGWAYYATGEFDSAVEALTAAADLAPESPSILYHLAAAQAKQGKHAEAATSLEQALKIDPVFPEAAKARALLNNVRSEQEKQEPPPGNGN